MKNHTSMRSRWVAAQNSKLSCCWLKPPVLFVVSNPPRLIVPDGRSDQYGERDKKCPVKADDVDDDEARR